MARVLVSLIIYVVMCSNTDAREVHTATPNSYQQAKELYKNKNYELAIVCLSKVEEDLKTNDFKPYTLFYKAMSLYHLNKINESLKVFTLIKEQYPQWNQLDECLYWLGYLNFINKNFKQTTEYLNSIKSKQLKADVHKLRKKVLNKELKENTLSIIEPEHKTTEENNKDTYPNRRKRHLRSLTSKFKKQYNVAVLLPFCIESDNNQNKKQPNYITDLYTGIKTAQESLKSMGININLTTYDTEKNPEKTRTILTTKNRENTDFILGPLYQTEIEEVNKFSQEKKINVLNPLSTNTEVFKNNDFTFLLQPSIETQATAIAKYTASDLLDNIKGNIGVVYGNSAEDSLMAHKYQEYIESNTDTNITLIENIPSEKAKNILFDFKENMKLKRQGKKYDEFYDRFEDLSYLFIASKKDELLINNMLALVDLFRKKPQIIGNLSWLNFSSLDYAQLKRLKAILISPEYINNKKQSVKQFKINYIVNFGTTPNYYAYVGYEAMMFIGCMLNEKGSYFQKNMTPYNGELFEKINYKGFYQDNQHVPITTIDKNLMPTIIN
jgi:hypothetical protein